MMGQSTPIFRSDAIDPEALESLTDSYDRVLEILLLTGELRAPSEAVSELLAQRIIELAQRGERDPKRLTIDALKFVRSSRALQAEKH
jgi:hypothetical protein